jgi:hypothetical protein
MWTPHLAAFQKLLGITDEQLMWRTAMQDDESAFTSLMNRWQPPIYRLCLRLTGDPHRAEDLSQETFSRVFSQRKAYQQQLKPVLEMSVRDKPLPLMRSSSKAIP